MSSFRWNFPASSMDNKCSVSCLNEIRHETKNLLEEQVSHEPNVLYMRDEKSGFKSQSIHVHAIGDTSLKYLSSYQNVSEKSNKDQSESSVPNTCGSFKKSTKQDEGNVHEELVPFTFVAVSELKEPNEGHKDDRMCFESVLKDPLLEYPSAILDVTEEKKVKKKFTFQSELCVKKEPKDENDVPESLTEDFILSDNLMRSYHMFSSTKCNSIESCDPESGMDRYPNVKLSDAFGFEGCDSETTHDFNIKFESICEISGADVKDQKVFETGQCLNHLLGGNTGAAILQPKSELDSVQDFSSIDYQQDVREEDCDVNTSKSSTPFSSEKGNITPAMYETPASSSAQTIFCEERKNLQKKTKESGSSSPDGSLISKNRHLRRLTGDRPFECKICFKKFFTAGYRTVHMRTHTGVRPFECEICKKSFYTKAHLSGHMRTHTGDRPFECEVCKKKFFDQRSLNQHVRTHTGDKPFECKVCKKAFSTSGHRTVHMRMHTGDRPYECEICGKTFRAVGHRSKHMLTHTNDRPFECVICKKSFTQKGTVTVHMRSHTGERPYQCNVCGRAYSTIGERTVHMRKHTGDRPFECEICKRTFYSKTPLYKHMRIHTGEKPFECVICKKKFSWPGNLTVHMVTHSDDRPFACEICEKTFSDKSRLSKHMRTHTGNKPFECEICKKTYSQSGHLKRHLRMHTGERPYECGICKKSFSMSAHLSRHMRMHTGERPYECGMCKKTFSMRAHLNRHVRIHTGDRPFECGICKKTFNESGHLKRHYRTHTNDLINVGKIIIQ